MPLKLKQLLPAIILFSFFASLYIYTAAPGVYDGDSGEIAAAVNELGLAHPTGFPLYMITGKLFSTLIPMRDLAFRLNIFSAVFTTSAIVLVYYTLRNFGNSSPSSLFASLILGFGRNTIWRNSGSANTYSLSLLLAVILFFIFSKWKREQKTSYIYWYGFLWGLSLGTHFIMVIMLIPAIFMLLQMLPLLKIKTRILANFLFVTALPTVQYLYLFFAHRRDTIVNWGSVDSFNDFFYYITQRQYASKIFTRDFQGTINFVKKTATLLVTETLVLFFIISVVGFILLWVRSRKTFLIFAVVITTNILIMWGYGKWEADLSVLYRYLFISNLILALAIAFGLDSIVRQVKRRGKKWLFVFNFVIVLGLLLHFKVALSDNNRANNFFVSDTAQNILNTLEPNALVLSYGDLITGPLWYYQSIGQREDVVVVAVALLRFDWYIDNINSKYNNIGRDMLPKTNVGQRIQAVIEKNITERPVYSVFFNSSSDNLLEKTFDFIPNGLVFRVVPKGWPVAKEIITSNKNIWAKYNLRNVKADFRQDVMLNGLAEYYAFTLYRNGIAYYDQGFVDESINFLEKSLEIYPQPITQRNLDYIKIKRSSK